MSYDHRLEILKYNRSQAVLHLQENALIFKWAALDSAKPYFSLE